MEPTKTVERARALIINKRKAPPVYAMHREAFIANLASIIDMACDPNQPSSGFLAAHVGDTAELTESWGQSACDEALVVIGGYTHPPLTRSELDGRAQHLLRAASASPVVTMRESLLAYAAGVLSMMDRLSHIQPFYGRHVDRHSMRLGLDEPVTVPWAQVVADDALRILRGSP